MIKTKLFAIFQKTKNGWKPLPKDGTELFPLGEDLDQALADYKDNYEIDQADLEFPLQYRDGLKKFKIMEQVWIDKT